MRHPLSGADTATLASVFRDAGPLSRKGSALAIRVAAAARSPASALEHQWVKRRLPDASEIPPPVFILGHWRSGTTHLYNVMAKAGFGYVPPLATGLPWDLFGIARAFRPLLERALPKSRYIDAIPVTPDSPQEDEFALANMSPISFAHALYFPQRFERHVARGLFFEGCSQEEVAAWRETFSYLMRKLALHQGAQLLIKNPAHTARVREIRAVFPKAKFIHIHRDPFAVFPSMRNYYAKLLPVMALQDFGHLDIDEAVLGVYPKMMSQMLEQTADLRPPNFVEVAYADLDSAPMETLERIYGALELEGFAHAAPRFEAYLATVERFSKNSFRRDPAMVAKVSERWAPFLERWRYATPELA
ncbi:MAG: sulfotransferase [Pseudomonadota bacterium]